MTLTWTEAEKIIKTGQIVVLPTDTIYGLVGQALNKKSVTLLNQIKQRPTDKAYIILISKINDLKLFNFNLTKREENILQALWPGPVSVILHNPELAKNYPELNPQNNSLAFRLPAKPELLNLIKTTGPLLAPSANPHKKPEATTIIQAEKYFNQTVSGYVKSDIEPLINKPSTIVKLTNHDKLEVIRQGSYIIPSIIKN